MIDLIDGTAWSYNDFLEDKFKKERIAAVNNWQNLCLDRDKASDVNKPLKEDNANNI